MKKIVTIGELGIIITGNTPPRNNSKLYGNYTPFIKATDISETEKYTYHPEEYYSEEGYNKYIKSLIPKGSTCVVTIGSIGKKMTMAHCDLFINQAMNAIIPNENFDNEYVYYAVKNILSNIKMLDSGTASGRENVSKSAFSKMQILIEDNIITQRRIATILSRYDSLIENYQKQIKLLEESAQRLYKEWFVDLRFPGHENTKIVDGVPEGWEKKKLIDFTHIVMGQSPKSEFYNNDKMGLPFHQGVGSFGSRFVVDNVYSSCFTKIAESNSILFSVRAPVGRINITNNKVAIGRGLASINHKKGFQSFLYYLLKSFFFEENIIGNGAIFASISKDDLYNLLFLIPDEKLVMDFNKVVSEIDGKIKNISKQIHKLTEARDRLLPKLMSGEIEV